MGLYTKVDALLREPEIYMDYMQDPLVELFLRVTKRGEDGASWTAKATCDRGSADVFFAAPNERGVLTQIRVNEAQAICNMCPVRLECLQEALDNYEEFGVWGGVNFENPEERTRIYRANDRRRGDRKKRRTAKSE